MSVDNRQYLHREQNGINFESLQGNSDIRSVSKNAHFLTKSIGD